MTLDDLTLDHLLELKTDGGVFRFAGRRVLLMDAVALGLLRKELVELLGLTATRGIMGRFGYSHGWRSAESLRDAVPWDHTSTWQRAGGRLHRLQGMVSFEPVHHDPGQDPTDGIERPFAEAIWPDSYEAEQHLLHLGLSDSPVCWTLCGFASGYLSRAFERPIYCIEIACKGRGDAVCRMEGRPLEAWDPATRAALRSYEHECLDDALVELRELLRSTEQELRVKRRALSDETEDGDEFGGIVAKSEAMRRALELADRVARVDSTVLLRGPTGVGKERVARFIHDRSTRAGGPFVAVDCGALPPQLLESELFGHAKGAFTGATTDRAGLFEAAHGGTLLLDELGETTPDIQLRLLRVLQEREVRRVGETRARPIDVRVLAATHRDMEADVDRGDFREDLYYRLRVVEIVIPPLRERPDDILPLARKLLAAAAHRLSRPVRGLAPGACERLVGHDWPGNVRELENAIERAVALARTSTIEADDLPRFRRRVETETTIADAPPESEALDHDPSMTLEAVERAHVLRVLEEAGGNRAEAARRLDIGAATLYRKLKRWTE